MDIVHHALIGAVGAAYAAALGDPLPGMAFLAGSVLPDLDVALMALGRRRYLAAHQGATHSLLVLPLLAGACVLLLSLLPGAEGRFLTVGCYLAALGGLLIHVALDLCNTFGIRLLWPLPKRVSLDAVFFVDVPTLTLTCITLAVLLGGAAPPDAAVACYAAAFLAYVVARGVANRRLRARLGADTVVPSGVHPTRAFYTRGDAGGVECGWADAASGAHGVLLRVPPPAPDVMAATRASAAYRDLEGVLRRLVPVEAERGQDGRLVRVVARCVAVPNFKNRFGEVTLTLADGRLEGEHARI